jgi:BASS family bile acid:Na+ symporter
VFAGIIERIAPYLHGQIRKRQSLSFYLWALALTVVIAKTISFIIDQPTSGFWVEISVGGCALAICLFQFYIGRKIAGHYHKTVTGGQGLGQKNTVLAIWMSQSYLNPIASIGPGAYVIWQNIVNSYQLWRRQHKSDSGSQ